MSTAVAQRYARALAEAAGPAADFRRIAEDLESLTSTYRESAELRDVFESPAVSVQQKVKILEAILDRLGVIDLTRRFARVLLAHYRMGLLEEIRAAFQRIVNDRLGIVQMKVVSAAPLSGDAQAALEARFAELTRKKVEAEYQVDPSLLGGIMAQIKSTIYDGTVRGYLNRLREQLRA